MSTSFQTVILDELEATATALNTAVRQPHLRVVVERSFSNKGTLHVLDKWDEVVRVDFDFQRRGAVLVFDHDPNEVLNGPASPRRFHLTVSDSQETKRLLDAWRARIDEYRRGHRG